MKIALLGATGAVGGYFLDKALAASHEVTVLVRSSNKLQEQKNLIVVQGDVTNPDDVQAVVTGAEVVVSCLGNVKGVLIMEKAFENVFSAAAAQPVPPKCLLITSIGCGGTSWAIKQMLKLIGGSTGFMDYERADARVLQEQKVNYVLVRPAALKEKPGNNKYRAFQGNGTFARPIAKEDVAYFLMDALSSDKWDNKGTQLAGVK